MKNFLLFTLLLLLTGCEKMFIGAGPENNPAGNFEVLWKTIDEKYGLFLVSHLNWDSLYSVYSSQINASTSSGDLWNISCQLLSHLDNAHVTLENEDHTKSYTPGVSSIEIIKGVSTELIKSKYLLTPVITGEGYITYGRIKNSRLGYIHILTFLGSENGRDWIRDMDQVINNLSDCEGLIVDVRNNGGGFTRNDLYAASFFVDREITYYISFQKTGTGHNDFGEPINKIIYPRPDSLKYVKKIAVLTNRFTGSGAEAFTLICNNMVNCTQIGDTTIGAIGEVSHVAQLPNGWTLFYPCTLTKLSDVPVRKASVLFLIF